MARDIYRIGLAGHVMQPPPVFGLHRGALQAPQLSFNTTTQHRTLIDPDRLVVRSVSYW